MKFARTLRFSIKRLFLLTLVSFIAVAALLGIAASANKANRVAKARAEQAANAKSATMVTGSGDKQQLAPTAASITATLSDNVTPATKVVPGGIINYTATITNNGAASPADDSTNLNFSAPPRLAPISLA
jgi:type II secretory pathway pseudopilin PulG